MTWKINKTVKSWPKLKNPVLIEGLPGIGNVGKVTVDFLINELDAIKICDFFSYNLPHSVFVNEENLVELPTIEIYHAKMKGGDLLFLAGDVQPTTEESSYEFCDTTLDLMEKLKCRQIVTLGGIGLAAAPKTPKVYCTGNSKEAIKHFKNGVKIDERLYGVVGPIVGVSGLLLGLAEKRKMPAVALLAETLGHPLYLGIKGAREILKILSKKFPIKINLKDLDKDIKEVEEEIMKKTDDLTRLPKKTSGAMKRDTDYIG